MTYLILRTLWRTLIFVSKFDRAPYKRVRLVYGLGSAALLP